MSFWSRHEIEDWRVAGLDLCCSTPGSCSFPVVTRRQMNVMGTELNAIQELSVHSFLLSSNNISKVIIYPQNIFKSVYICTLTLPCGSSNRRRWDSRGTDNKSFQNTQEKSTPQCLINSRLWPKTRETLPRVQFKINNFLSGWGLRVTSYTQTTPFGLAVHAPLAHKGGFANVCT